MYITHDNQTYANVRVYSTSSSVRFTGDSLSGVTALTGPVGVFADNGFDLQTFVPIDYLRQEIKDGSWLLTNIPLPEPQPEPVLSPKEQRERTYETEPLIEYEGDMITVDEANKLFLQYSAEGNTQKYMDLQILIGRAKADVRARFPDGEETTNE